jgi:asparagine synthase (glutamine-hydrolysing)
VLAQLADLETGIARINTYFDPPYRRRLLGDAVGEFPSPEEYKVALQQPYATPLRKITAMDFHSFLVDDILVKVDRASMLTSLEVRAPFLDHSIIEFAFSAVPDALRATAREKKILPRRLAAKLLPASMDLKRKQGFMLPLQAWFRGRWGAFCEEVLREAPAALFRPEAVETLLTQQRRGFSHTQRLFALTMFELWRREYNVALPGE